MARVGFLLFLTFVAATLAGGGRGWSDPEIALAGRRPAAKRDASKNFDLLNQGQSYLADLAE